MGLGCWYLGQFIGTIPSLIHVCCFFGFFWNFNSWPMKHRLVLHLLVSLKIFYSDVDASYWRIIIYSFLSASGAMLQYDSMLVIHIIWEIGQYTEQLIDCPALMILFKCNSTFYTFLHLLLDILLYRWPKCMYCYTEGLLYTCWTLNC